MPWTTFEQKLVFFFPYSTKQRVFKHSPSKKFLYWHRAIMNAMSKQKISCPQAKRINGRKPTGARLSQLTTWQNDKSLSFLDGYELFNETTNFYRGNKLLVLKEFLFGICPGMKCSPTIYLISLINCEIEDD